MQDVHPYPGSNMMQIIQRQYRDSMPICDNNLCFIGLYSPTEKAVQRVADDAYVRAAESAYATAKYNQQLQRKAGEAELRIREKAVKNEIDEASAERKLMRAADIRSRAELQGKKVKILDDGTVLYVKDTFNDPAVRNFPFTIGAKIIFRCEGINEKILGIGYRLAEKEGGIYLWTDRLRAREISLKFNEAGLTGGYSQKREADFRMVLVQECLVRAHEEYLPERPGWNLLKTEMQFIFPGILTWKEVEKYAGKRN